MFVQAIEDILTAQCSPRAVRAVQAGGKPQALWDSIAEAGFLDLVVSESAGGAELPLSELCPILALLGRFAMPLPVAQSICARALTESPGELPDTPITLAPALVRAGDGSITCPRVPFGAMATHVIAADGDCLLLLPTAGSDVSAHGAGHSHLATLGWRDAAAGRKISGTPEALRAISAALHAAVMSGAMERVLEMTLEYCNDRQQFGRPLGKFQVIQHQLSAMSEHVAAVSIAAQAAFDTGEITPAWLPAAMAKSRASRAVVQVSNTAHALHGAIGVTEEYDLQLFTRLLHAWRVSHGSESYWDALVGRAVLDSDKTLAEFVRATGAKA